MVGNWELITDNWELGTGDSQGYSLAMRRLSVLLVLSLCPAAVLAQSGRRVIILEAGGYFNESDFVQLEPLAYRNLFLRGGFFPSADGMVSIAAGAPWAAAAP